MSESDVQSRAKLFPKDRHEMCVAVGDDGAGQSMVLHDVLDELVCGVNGRGFLPRRDEVRHLGSSVRYCEYAVEHSSVPGDSR